MMTELKPCPFCGSKKHLIIDDYYDPEMEVYFGFTVICNAAGWEGADKGCGAAGAWGGTKEQAVNIWNTRAVPDVPVLVRYEFSEVVGEHVERDDGEYVRYGQAAEMLAALKAELYDMRQERDRALGWRDHDKERAEAAEAKLEELETAWLNAEGKISELEAKLAQVKRIITIG